MTRTFLHSLDPPSASPIIGATVDVDVTDIEDAGIREVLQTPGRRVWGMVYSRRAPCSDRRWTPSIVREPLPRRPRADRAGVDEGSPDRGMLALSEAGASAARPVNNPCPTEA
jgi:hypothetical protein